MLTSNIVKTCKTLISRQYFMCSTINERKSYYDLLGIKSTSTKQQIRAQFLKKAKQLHPDYNDSQEAHEQFRKIKQAYQTLKDPQKRFIYDSGLSDDPQAQTIYKDAKFTGKRKYYQNKWYGFRKSQHSDQRDQYYEESKNFATSSQSISKYQIGGLVFVVLSLVGYQYFFKRKSYVDTEKQHTRIVLQGQQPEDKQRKRLNMYMRHRTTLNKIQ